MKNILVLADGKTAQRFLDRLINTDTSPNRYSIVFYTETITPAITESEKFKYFKFDPTSLVKLRSIVERYDFFQCMLILNKQGDFNESYKNLRIIDPNIQIVAVDRWCTEFNDPNITTIDLHDTVSNIFSNYLPDFPLFAQNLGLGTGEIMELKVPSGSSYSYRHLRNINQKRWKIAAIFREHKLIIPLPSTVLLPNDSILIVGNPNVLKGIYKSIKRESGQFPIPYGENIYCYIDMDVMSDDEIVMMANDALILHSKLNNRKLIFKIVNSRMTTIIDKIKSYSNKSLIVEFEYHKNKNIEIIQNDINIYYIGLIITTEKYLNKNLSMFYRLKLPILKIGCNGFLSIKSGLLLSSDSSKVQKTSSTIFDLSSQLEIDISLYDTDTDDSIEHKKVVSDFKSLAKSFNKKINLIESDGNPILKLKERDDFLQFIIFEKKLLDLNFFSYFSTDVEQHYFRFKNIYQIFIPSDT